MPSKKMEMIGCANFLAAFPTISVFRLISQLNTCSIYQWDRVISPVKVIEWSPQFPLGQEAPLLFGSHEVFLY